MTKVPTDGLLALVQEVLAAKAWPGGSILGAVLDRVTRRRLKVAMELLTSQVRRGEKTLAEIDEDEIAAVLYRYGRAAQEGAARVNLRLMAKVIAGQAYLGNLVADEFLYYADMLASLRYDEVLLLATLYRYTVSGGKWPSPGSYAFDSAMTSARGELVPSPFPTIDDFMSAAASAMRTGLVIVGGQGGLLYTVTPLMHRLQQIAPFEAAIREEQSEQRAEPVLRDPA